MFGKTTGCGACSVTSFGGIFRSLKLINCYYYDYAASLETLEVGKGKVGGLIIIEICKNSLSGF